MNLETQSSSNPRQKTLGTDGLFALLLLFLDCILLALLVSILSVFVSSYSLLLPLVFPGAAQFVYKGPLLIWFWRSGRKRAFRVYCYSAAVLFLLNSACFGLLGINALLN